MNWPDFFLGWLSGWTAGFVGLVIAAVRSDLRKVKDRRAAREDVRQ